MSFDNLVQTSKKYFPDLQIKYKDQSLLMKLLGKVLFFNKTFMTHYTTTIGSTIYYPNESFIKSSEVSAATILLHELVHIKDAKKYSKILFGFLYLTPQIFILLFFPLIFINWKIALPFLLFAAPLPSYFRMYFEKRAYLASLYSINAISQKMNFKPLLASQEQFFVNQFKNSSYYFMWIFGDIQKDFDAAVIKIKSGERPFEDPIFDILDKLTESV